LKRFRGREDGGVLIENILWIPVILMIMLAILDASFMFMNYARAQRFVQQGMRSYMTGEFKSCAELESWLNSNLTIFIASANATCAHQGSGAAILASLETRDMDLTGAAGLIGNARISFTSDGTYEYVPVD